MVRGASTKAELERKEVMPAAGILKVHTSGAGAATRNDEVWVSAEAETMGREGAQEVRGRAPPGQSGDVALPDT